MAVPEFDSGWQVFLTALVPLIAAVVGYVTNVLAIQMTFSPIKFHGVRICRVPIGWQGIIPSKARAMAEKSCDIITTRLMGVGEVFARLDEKGLVHVALPTIREEVTGMADKILRDYVSDEVRPVLPESFREELIEYLMEESPALMERVVNEMKTRIEEILDLKATVVRVTVKDKQILNRIFQTCGDQEFRFIEKSGFYFGFLFGLVQMTVFIFFRHWWTLPLFGFFVGWITNYLAITIIFRPVQPTTCCGYTACCGRRLQGLFLQRQDEVAEAYSKLVASEVLRTEHLVEDLDKGEGAHVLYDIVCRHVNERMGGRLTGFSGIATRLLLGNETLARLEKNICDMTMRSVPRVMLAGEEFLREQLAVEETLRHRLESLPSEHFEQMLHPVFEEDEWKLIATGAALGLVIGFAQGALHLLAV